MPFDEKKLNKAVRDLQNKTGKTNSLKKQSVIPKKKVVINTAGGEDLYQKAILAYRSKKFDQAKKLFSQVQSKYSTNKNLVNRAKSAQRRIQTSQTGIPKQNVSKNVESLYVSGIKAYQSGNYKKANQIMSSVLKISPGYQKAISAKNRIKNLVAKK